MHCSTTTTSPATTKVAKTIECLRELQARVGSDCMVLRGSSAVQWWRGEATPGNDIDIDICGMDSAVLCRNLADWARKSDSGLVVDCEMMSIKCATTGDTLVDLRFPREYRRVTAQALRSLERHTVTRPVPFIDGMCIRIYTARRLLADYREFADLKPTNSARIIQLEALVAAEDEEAAAAEAEEEQPPAVAEEEQPPAVSRGLFFGDDDDYE